MLLHSPLNIHFIEFIAQTPDAGINFDTSSVLKAPVGKENENTKPLGWFRTMVECNKDRSPEKPHSWPDISHGITLCF